MNWTSGLLAAGFALSLVAAGCGDDDTTPATGGTGGSTKAGTSGGGTGGTKAGTGGASGGGAGKSGSGGASGGAAVTPAMCMTQTTTNTAGSVTPECITCACGQDAKALVACDANCWKVLQCASVKCASVDKSGKMACAISMCSTEISAAGATALNATPVGDVLQGTMCSSKCITAPMMGDAGTADGGH
jgi:hypothetical protein